MRAAPYYAALLLSVLALVQVRANSSGGGVQEPSWRRRAAAKTHTNIGRTRNVSTSSTADCDCDPAGNGASSPTYFTEPGISYVGQLIQQKPFVLASVFECYSLSLQHLTEAPFFTFIKPASAQNGSCYLRKSITARSIETPDAVSGAHRVGGIGLCRCSVTVKSLSPSWGGNCRLASVQPKLEYLRPVQPQPYLAVDYSQDHVQNNLVNLPHNVTTPGVNTPNIVFLGFFRSQNLCAQACADYGQVRSRSSFLPNFGAIRCESFTYFFEGNGDLSEACYGQTDVDYHPVTRPCEASQPCFVTAQMSYSPVLRPGTSRRTLRHGTPTATECQVDQTAGIYVQFTEQSGTWKPVSESRTCSYASSDECLRQAAMSIFPTASATVSMRIQIDSTKVADYQPKCGYDFPNSRFSVTTVHECSVCPFCHGNGVCNASSNYEYCLCKPGWNRSTDCSTCESSAVLDPSTHRCVGCPLGAAGNACSGHGECAMQMGNGSSCECDVGYNGTACDECVFGFFRDPDLGVCMPCPGVSPDDGTGAPCSGHGICLPQNGTCVCASQGHFSGLACGTCEPGWSGPLCRDISVSFSKWTLVILSGVGGVIAIGLLIFLVVRRRGQRRARMRQKLTRPLLGAESISEMLGTDGTDANEIKELLDAHPDLEHWLIPFRELEIQDEVGAGTSGQVFRGQYQGDSVAVKRLFRRSDTRWDMDHFLRHEAGVIAKLHHPSILRFYGIACHGLTMHIVTEFCPTSLSSWLRSQASRPLPELYPKMLQMLLDIAQGMAYMHTRRVIHRDLKPENVLLDGRLHAKLCDFSLSRFLRGFQNLAMTGAIGTPAFMGPELMTIGTTTASSKVDVYSFGITIWCCMSRCDSPFMDLRMDHLEFVRRVKGGMRPELPDETPAAMAELMSSCCRADPEDRPSFVEIVTTLKAAMQMDAPGEGEPESKSAATEVGPLRRVPTIYR